MDDLSNVKVSVRLMVYNNEPFIRAALDGALMQKTDFKYEIVIGDDFSTDGTLEILKEYKDKYPEVINLLDRPVGGAYYKKRKASNYRENFMDILKHCQGEYIALLDGDDYWIDELKLQKQVDFLEKNPKYNLCGHRSAIWREGDGVLGTLGVHGTYSQKDFVQNTRFQTSTMLFRNKPELYSDYTLFPVADAFLKLDLTQNGALAYCLEQTMSVYRVHVKGVNSLLDSSSQMDIVFDVLKHTKQHYPHLKHVCKIATRDRMLRHVKFQYTLEALVSGKTPFYAFWYQFKQFVKRLVNYN